MLREYIDLLPVLAGGYGHHGFSAGATMGRSTYLFEFGVAPGAMRLATVEVTSDLDDLRSRVARCFASIKGLGRRSTPDQEPDGLKLLEYGFDARLWQVHRGTPVKVTNLCRLVDVCWGATRMPVEMVFSLQRLGHGPADAPESWIGKAVTLAVQWDEVDKELRPLEGKALRAGQSVCLPLESLPTELAALVTDTHVPPHEALYYGMNDVENGMDDDPRLNPTAYQLRRALLEAEDAGRLEATCTEVLFSSRDPGKQRGAHHLICRESGAAEFWVKTRVKGRWSWSQGDLDSVISALPELMQAEARSTIEP